MAEKGSVLLKNDGRTAAHRLGQDDRRHRPDRVQHTHRRYQREDRVHRPALSANHAPQAVDCPNPVAPLDAITARAAQDGNTVVFNNGSNLAAAAALAATADVVVVFGYNFGGEYFDLSSMNLACNGGTR